MSWGGADSDPVWTLGGKISKLPHLRGWVNLNHTQIGLRNRKNPNQPL